MKKIVLSLLLSLFAIHPLSAALSPLDQSIKEIRTILDSQELRSNLQTSDAIQDIWKVGGRYVVSTENRQMVVEVTYTPRKTPGPQEFSLKFFPAKPYGE